MAGRYRIARESQWYRVMAKQLTVKEAKLVKGVVQGKPKYKAAVEAGYSEKSARSIATETLKKPNIQEALQAELAKQGITLEKIIKPIKDGLEAEKVSIVGNGDEAMAEITPDHSIRLKASDMAQKLMGVKANQENPGGNTYIFNKGDIVKKKYIKE